LILRQLGVDEALMTLQAISPFPIELLDATPQRACQAADVKAKYKLHYSDSFAAALAIEHKAKLVTSDSHFRKLGHSFPVVWLKG
jgi:predicted nucleic acid-binding protein